MRPGSSKRIVGLAACLALGVAFGGGSASARSDDAVVAGSFAGKVQAAAVGVAVVAEKPAVDGQARAISVYICNGSSLSVWLTTRTAGNTADLKSADGRVGVHVELAPLNASGKVGFAGGSGFAFAVPRALGVAGLFDVNILASGLLRGTSTTGGSLTGRAGAGRTLLEGETVTATVSAGGRNARLSAPGRHLTPGAYRWIVSSDGQVWGANRLGPIRGGIGGFVRSTTDKHTRIKGGSAGQKGYDNRKCQTLANQVNALSEIFARALDRQDVTTANRAAFAAQAKLTELEDHCLVIED
jgi:hypothetical protein